MYIEFFLLREGLEMALENYEPKLVLHYFEELTKIPRGTYDCKRVSDYCVEFAKNLGLEYIQDEAYNVVIKKPGTPGYENSDPVIIQGHLDMVCEKTPDSAHDFKNDPLELYVEDGNIRAKDTTLGGDDGIAIAYAMAVLAGNDLEHPPIEALFTTDEEEGMGGANAIDMSVLKGRMLINIDSEEEGTLIVGCEGGYENPVTVPVEREERKGTVITVSVKGLRGGHSGIEIHTQRGNANKLMGRLLMTLAAKDVDYNLVEINGGSKPNVIAQSATAKLVVNCPNCAKKALEVIEAYGEDLKVEFGKDEPSVEVTASTEDDQTVNAMTKESTKKITFFVTATPDGVQCNSRDIEGLVETSLNLGIVSTREDSVWADFRVRSSVQSKKDDMKVVLAMWAEFLGGTATVEAEYPAWVYKADSKLRPIMIDTYAELFGHEPEVATIHAGLECGLFAGKLEGLDSVSFGPAMGHVHSVNEFLNIESVARMWEYLKAVLKNCK